MMPHDVFHYQHFCNALEISRRNSKLMMITMKINLSNGNDIKNLLEHCGVETALALLRVKSAIN
jgi:hypothetical protein